MSATQGQVIDLTVSWKAELIALSVFVSVFGSYTTIQLLEQLRESRTTVLKQTWAGLASFGFGTCAVWGMHFIGMLAADLGVSVEYHAGYTVLSWLACVIAVRTGLSIAFQHWLRTDADGVSRYEIEMGRPPQPYIQKTLSTPSIMSEDEKVSFKAYILALLSEEGHSPYIRLVGGGALIGAGVCVMHYTGMAAMTYPGLIMKWKPGIVALSCVIAVTVATVGLFIFDRFHGFFWNIGSSCVIGAAVLTMHYTAMHAAEFSLDLEAAARGSTGGHIPQDGLALLVAVAAFATSFLLVGAVAAITERTRRQLDKQVDLRTAELSQAKAASEKLLYNILPPEVVEHLRKSSKLEDGNVDIGNACYSRAVENATVIFVDIVGFTEMCSDLSSHQVVSFLDNFFTRFDRICAQNGVQKIKTIGDAYLAVAGLSRAVTTGNDSGAMSAERAMRVAKSFQAAAMSFSKEYPETPVRVRIGMHSGPLVAGVICESRFAYDVWGDTVNVASRMETISPVGGITCSRTTYEKLLKRMPGVASIMTRGSHDVKGKGVMDTFSLAPNAHPVSPATNSKIDAIPVLVESTVGV